MNHYQKILETEGPDAAKAYMRQVSQKAHSSGKPMGFATMDEEKRKEVASKGGAALWKKLREKTDDSRPSTGSQE